jgi:Carboxypeptidase regulatory-like domain
VKCRRPIVTCMQSPNYRLYCDCRFFKYKTIMGKELLLSGLLLLLFASMSFKAPCEAAVVWSDNFDDGNLDGWTTSGAYPFEMKGTIARALVPGNFSAADKTLRATGAPRSQAYSFITHPTVTVGTWSWDLYCNVEGAPNNLIGLADWIDRPNITLPFDWNGHGVDIGQYGGIIFKRIDNGSYLDIGRGSWKPKPGSWTHIDMTHDSEGRWLLYINGTLCMDKVDKQFSEFGYFGLWLQPGPAIDNVVVSDTIYVPPGSIRVSVKDSGGNALSGAAVSSSKQPSGQTALSGTTATDGTITFTGLAVGNYTLQVSKSGYVSGSAQGAVASGAKTEASTTLQAQPASSIPGFPFMSIIIGVLIFTAWLWLYKCKQRQRDCVWLNHKRALIQLQVIAIIVIVVISGVGIGHFSVKGTFNVNSELENYVVTEEYPQNILSVISTSGNRTIIYDYQLNGAVEIFGLAIDSYGNFIVTAPWRGKLSRITPAGVRTDIYNFTNSPAPIGLAIDPSGNYIVTEFWASKLSKVTPTGVRTVIYNFTANTNPRSVAIDSSGNYIVTEAGTNMLSKVTPAGVRTVIYDFGASAEDDNLSSVAIDSSGNYIVTEFESDKLSKVTPAGMRSVIYNFNKDAKPWGLAIDSQGNYIVAELLANVLSKITPAGERTVIYEWAQAGVAQRPAGVAILTAPKVGDLKVTVKDSSGAVVSGASVLSTSQPSGQSTLSGTSANDGTIAFSKLLLGSYTVQASKSGYVTRSAQGSVVAGKTAEISITLQAQPSSGIPGFPLISIVVGMLLCATWYWLYARRLRLGGV